jgi:hypothetical protein
MSTNDAFDRLDQVIREQGADAGFDLLARQLRDEKNYPLLFETRLMQKRRDLGLPLIQTDSADSWPESSRRAYDDGLVAAAREVGGLFLADGDIARAWPYFRAIGESAPVAEAIGKAEAGEGIEPVIEIAYHERVHPKKGFELILAHHGICRAITSFEHYPSREGREDCARLLIRTLHSELVESLKRTIAKNEESVPDTRSVPELIAGRDWLFGEYSYYVDTSHVASCLRISLELSDRETLGLAVELAAYGQKLSSQFSFRSEPPFEDCYRDHAVYIRALLGEDVDAAIAHFRGKLTDGDPLPAEGLVALLARLKRYPEAIDVAREHLRDVPPAQLSCPAVLQLCQMAGDYQRMTTIAREQGDLLSYVAALTG